MELKAENRPAKKHRAELPKHALSAQKLPHSGLAALIPNISAEEFLRSRFLHKPHLFHGPLHRLPDISNCKSLQSMESFLSLIEEIKAPRFRTRGWFQGPTDKHLRLVLESQSAKALFRSRIGTLVVDSLNHEVKPIQELMLAIQKDLGTPMTGISCNSYAAPKGLGSPMHYDPQEVFFLQIIGEKRWKIAPNLQISHPISFQDSGPTPLHMKEIQSKLPTQLPKQHETIVLKPGSVLYMPRGYWHECETLKDSLHFTLTFPSSTWTDIILEKLRGQLIQDPKWREPALGAGSKGRLGEKARKQELQLLMELIGRVLKN